MSTGPEDDVAFESTMRIDAAAAVTHPPVEGMSAEERAHLGIGEPS